MGSRAVSRMSGSNVDSDPVSPRFDPREVRGSLTRWCPVCERITSHSTEGDCQNCAHWNRLHTMTGTTLSREYVLANTNDGTEYVPPVLPQEFEATSVVSFVSTREG